MTAATEDRVRVIVVDDEPLARRGLTDLLQQIGGVTVVGEAATGREAIALVHRVAPAIVFLDIEMPDLDGFQALRHLGPERRPAVVFVTAHERHAMTAFELDAADYLLKPFHLDRLQRAVRRARALQRRHQAGATITAVHVEPTWAHDRDRFVVKQGESVVFIEPQRIDWIESDGNYLTLHVAGATHTMRETLTTIEQRLDPTLFIRVSRSIIVNAGAVRVMQRHTNGGGTVRLSTGDILPVSRRCRAAVEAFLELAPLT